MVILIPCTLLFVGCSNDKNNGSVGQNPSDQTEFVEIDSICIGNSYYQSILVNKATRVMYACYSGQQGQMTVLVNADGTPMIYQGEL